MDKESYRSSGDSLSILLLGMGQALADQLVQALQSLIPQSMLRTTRPIPVLGKDAPLHQADLVFCASSRKDLREFLTRTRDQHPALPVIVVSEAVHATEWLNVLEWGAADYFPAPFDPGVLASVIESNVSVQRLPVC